MKKHILVEKNAETMLGVCQACGPVSLVMKSGGLRCSVARNQQWLKANNKRRGGTFDSEFTLEDKAEMLEQQDHKCLICSEEITMAAHMDHCHDTGKIRGLLCASCNLGLGWFKDDPVVLRRAADYLER